MQAELISSKICIVGTGNVLRGNDGFGPYVIQSLAKTEFFHKDELLEAGLSGFQCLHLLEHKDFVFLVDLLVDDGYPPGEILFYKGSQTQRQSHNLHATRPLELYSHLLCLPGSPLHVYFVFCVASDVAFPYSMNLDRITRQSADRLTSLLIEWKQSKKAPEDFFQISRLLKNSLSPTRM